MKKEIILQGQKIQYHLKMSTRAKNVRFTIYRDGFFVVTIPRRVREDVAIRFMQKKSDWIISKLTNKSGLPKVPYGDKKYLEHKEDARAFIHKRLNFFNNFYKFQYKRVSVRRQRTRWGSCSEDGNLNFNYRLLFLPEHLADYIIVHELCHLKELNHSKNFWNLVALTIPDYKKRKKEINV